MVVLPRHWAEFGNISNLKKNVKQITDDLDTSFLCRNRVFGIGFVPIVAAFLFFMVQWPAAYGQQQLLGNSTPWFFTSSAPSGQGSMTDNTTTGTVTWTPSTTGGAYTMLWTYFAAAGSPKSLNVGDSITYNFTLTSTLALQAGQVLRVGLFNSNPSGQYTPSGNQYNTIANTAFANDTGYAAYVDVGSTDTTNNTFTYERVGAPNNVTLWSSGNYTTLGTSGAQADAQLQANTPYKGSVTVTRLVTGMQLTTTIGNFSSTEVDTNSSQVSFDMISFLTISMPSGNALTLSNMSVVYATSSSASLNAFGVNGSDLMGANYQAICSQIIASGVKWVRIGPAWSWIEEPSKGNYNTALLTQIDYIISTLTQNGVNVEFILCYTATWASTEPSSPNAVFYPPANQSDWSSYVSFITNRYKGKIKYWEVWNEEDGGGFWLGTVNQYYTLLQTAATAVRATDPTNQVLLGGLAASVNGVDSYGLGTFFDTLMGLGAGSYFDIVNYHSYGESWRLLKVYNGMMAVVNKYNIQSKPIWITETGYTTQGTSTLEATKADYLDGVYVMNSRFPNVTRTLFYCYINTVSSPPDAYQDNFGMCQSNLSPLVALAHYQGLGEALTNYSLEANYPTLTPNTLTLDYLPETSGDGSHVTNYNSAGTQKQIAQNYYMYFGINNNYWYQSNGGIDTNAYIDVTYLDNGSGTWNLDYDSISNAYAPLSCAMTNTGKWLTKTFAITGAYFGNRENNLADFRIMASNGGPLVIGNVDVRKETNTGQVLLQSTDIFKLVTHIVDTNPADDGYNPPATVGGVPCREIQGNSSLCCFQVNQGLVAPQDANITVGITYWDLGTDRIDFQYNAIGNAYKHIPTTKTNTSTWKTVWFDITDANFNHSQNYNGDMLIDNAGDGSVEYVSSVVVINNNPGSL